ncbi:MAG: hypothetical protein QF415_13570 [Candidatus Undinarchaeales archaeon]|nr:hypothetical protein [Candidatus Undinarchaeales archaeon]MDP7494347.1 hypothetical protein [Candidatus Undinarchaeales archaeon]
MVLILDPTLEAGEQTPGVYFAPHIKLAIVGLPDRIGADLVEAGHPAESDEIEHIVRWCEEHHDITDRVHRQRRERTCA